LSAGNLYFAPKDEDELPDQRQQVKENFNERSETTTTSQEEEEEEEIEDEDDDDTGGGYVIDILPRPKSKPERRDKSGENRGSDSDFNPTDDDYDDDDDVEDNYYEDADFGNNELAFTVRDGH